ncbi:MAG: ABC transporter ATP-binding protein [Bilophila sp.]
MNIIETENLNKYYGSGENRVHVLRDVTFSVQDGDFVAIIGQSGSGKSTLMNILGCLDTQSSGVCRIGGVDIGTLGSDELAELRGKRIGFIFQRYNLLSTLSATENVALPAVYAGVDRKTRLERARRLLGNLGLDDKLENRPNELSGGQQQRVSIARALMNGGEHHPRGRAHRRARFQERRERHGHPHRSQPAGAYYHRGHARSPHRRLRQPDHRNQGRRDHFRYPQPRSPPPAGTRGNGLFPRPPSSFARTSSWRRSRCRCRPSLPTRCAPC